MSIWNRCSLSRVAVAFLVTVHVGRGERQRMWEPASRAWQGPCGSCGICFLHLPVQGGRGAASWVGFFSSGPSPPPSTARCWVRRAGRLPRSLTNLVLYTTHCHLLQGENKRFVQRFLGFPEGLVSKQVCTCLESRDK